jgi:hypothetical protein
MANQNHSKILQLLEKKQLNLSNKNGGDEVEQWREEHGEVQDSSSDLPQRLKAAEEACRVAQVHDDDMKRPKVIVCKTQESEWTAIVQFNDEQDAKFLITLASKSNGIPLKSTAEISHISLLDARKRLNLVREGLDGKR